jgi:YYY domain-containing protein
MGNLQGLMDGLYAARALPQGFWRWLDIPGMAGSYQSGDFFLTSGWWWWRASRVLKDYDLFGRPVPYQPIDEFPFFSFLLGDNHPHKIALPFVLLAAGIAFNGLLRAQTGSAGSRREQAAQFLSTALALGALGFLNTWDFPILLGITVLAAALGRWVAKNGKFPWLFAARTGLLLGAAAVGCYLFFYLSFSSQAGGVLPHIFPPTRLPQYLVMFAPTVAPLAFFLLFAAAQRGARWVDFLRAWAWTAGVSLGLWALALLAGVLALNRAGLGGSPALRPWLGDLAPAQALERIFLARAQNPWLFLLLSALIALAAVNIFHRHRLNESSQEEPATRFAALLGFAGLALTLLVEFFYLRDQFGMRMNTVFKFYFLGWVLIACAAAYGAWWLSARVRGALRRIALFVCAALALGGLVYPIMGVISRAERFSRPPNLDAAATFQGFYPEHPLSSPDDWAAILWLRENGRRADGSIPIILEAGSRGYEVAGRISAFTGYPTLLGWTNHEGQWRGSWDEINRRTPEIEVVYTTFNITFATQILNKWGVDYVILGAAERQYIEALCREDNAPCDPNRARGKFLQAFEPVFQQGEITIYRIR